MRHLWLLWLNAAWSWMPPSCETTGCFRPCSCLLPYSATPLFRLYFKWEALWGEVCPSTSSLSMSRWPADSCTPTSSWKTLRTGGLCPIPNFSGLNTFFLLQSSTWRPSPLFCRFGGWCHWISEMLICIYRSTPVNGSIFGVPPRTQQGSWLYFNGRFSLLVYALPQSFYHTPGSCRGPLASVGMYLVPVYNIDDILHGQASANQVARTCNLTQFPLSLQARVCHRPPEVDPHPVSGDDLSWGPDQHSQGSGFSLPGQTETLVYATQELLDLTQISAQWLLASCHVPVPLCILHHHLLSNILRDHFDMRVDCPQSWSLDIADHPGIWGSQGPCIREALFNLPLPLMSSWQSHPCMDRGSSAVPWQPVECGWVINFLSISLFLMLETVFLTLDRFHESYSVVSEVKHLSDCGPHIGPQ